MLSNLKTVKGRRVQCMTEHQCGCFTATVEAIQAEGRRKHQLTQRPQQAANDLLNAPLNFSMACWKRQEMKVLSSWHLMFTFTWISCLTFGLSLMSHLCSGCTRWSLGTCDSRIVGVLLAAAVLLSVCALLRVLQTQLVTNLESLANGPNDTHGLTLARW